MYCLLSVVNTLCYLFYTFFYYFFVNTQFWNAKFMDVNENRDMSHLLVPKSQKLWAKCGGSKKWSGHGPLIARSQSLTSEHQKPIAMCCVTKCCFNFLDVICSWYLLDHDVYSQCCWCRIYLVDCDHYVISTRSPRVFLIWIQR